MKKSFQLICLAFVALVTGVGLRLIYTLPVDTQPYIEKKYAGWNGVLQAWICSDWAPGGSFIRWLNSCASDFEKNHEGVYLEFTPVSAGTINTLADSNIRKPDLLFFSPGVLSNPDLLAPLQSSVVLHNDLQSYGDKLALPVALGGYIWAYNTSLCEKAPSFVDEVTVLSLPSGKQGYSAALLGLLSIPPEGNINTPLLPNNGIDLGLPASAEENSLFSDQALDLFITGKIPCIPISSSDLSRLIQLRDNGRGPDWKLYPSGSIICTDQILLCGIPAQEDRIESGQIAEEFLHSLLDSEAQSRLADIGAHSVTGETIYTDFTPYAEMEALLNSRPLWLPDCFSEYSSANIEAIVRRFLNKEFPAKKALCLIGFEGM